MGQLVVYTAIFGEFDYLAPALCRVPHVCYTDQAITARGWEVRVVERKFEDARREARYYKTHPDPNAKISVWVDGHIRIKDPWSQMRYMEGGIALHGHRRRHCLYQEGAHCVKEKKANADIVRAQLARYRAKGYPENNGLVETGLLVREKTHKIGALNRLWWAEIVKGSARDQISFNYVVWRLGLDYGTIPGKIYRNRALVFHKHGPGKSV